MAEGRKPRRWLRWLRRAFLALVAIVLVLVAAAFWRARRAWPQVEGEAVAAGLAAPVEVVRDRWGVPHIRAGSESDLFFAQGYVHAQDRLWQMEMNRRVGRGELSEVLGEHVLILDVSMRTLGLRRAAERDWARMDPETRAVLEAYARGVNAFLATHRGRLPVEFSLLGIEPRPWQPVDSLVWGKVMCWNLAENYNFEVSRARLIARLSTQAAQDLLPPWRDGEALAIPPGTAGYAWMRGASLDGVEALAAFFADPGPSWGSNNWAVHGSRTATGKPLLANDTHLALSMPSLWYENALHGGRFQVAGFSLPGVPMVLLGHNERIAWGVTDMIPDVQDFYIEKVDDPKKPSRYLFQGAWRPVEVVRETIPVRGRDPEEVEVRLTHHGPVMNEVVARLHGIPEVLTLRWAGVEPGDLLEGLRRVNLARDWAQFRDGLRRWDAPNLNFVYADVDGNIGYQATGDIPLRAPGHQGLVPVPGWTGDHEWRGFIPFDELPTAFNPPEGFVVTANDNVAPEGYPHHLAYEWADPFRVARLRRLLAAGTKLTRADVERMQADTYSLPAEALRPHLLRAAAPESDLERRALETLRAWDLRNGAEAPGAALFQVWYRALLHNTVGDELGEELMREYQRYEWIHGRMMVERMARARDRWFDDVATPAAEDRDAIVRRSFAEAVRWLAGQQGEDPERWRWGGLHKIRLAHRPLGEAGLPLISGLFNGDPVEVPGDRFSVDSYWFSFDPARPYEANGGPAHRFIADLGDLDNSVGIQNSGQSGHLFHPHREDFVPLWRRVAYHPMPFRPERVREAAAAVLTLQPRGPEENKR